MVQGTLKADSLVVGEFTVTFLRSNPEMRAKAALVESQSGQTHGWTHRSQWSKQTMEKLQELRQLMEADLADSLFAGGGSGSVGGVQKSERLVPMTGIGEHIGDDAPQIETPE